MLTKVQWKEREGKDAKKIERFFNHNYHFMLEDENQDLYFKAKSEDQYHRLINHTLWHFEYKLSTVGIDKKEIELWHSCFYMGAYVRSY